MPSWATHRRLVALAWPQGLPKGDLYRGVIKGVVEPDVVSDMLYVKKCGGRKCRWALAPPKHHELQISLVEYYYNLAQYYRARGDLYNAGRALGRALHYIQDGAVKTKKWLILNVHDSLEKEIEGLLNKMPEICRGVRAERSNNPIKALCHAYQQTAALLIRFRDEVVPPDDAVEFYKRGRRKKLALIAAGLVAAVIGLSTYAWLLLAGVVAAATAATWTPREYILTMRGGYVCLKPKWGKAVMSC
ncbi:hypothetical protein [Pyrobaculum aerophilum]|uniref:hypothetical protein n=1 Tax=Pyrobaculum aerophilum TaxID=13773 RepID=UPI002FD9563F